MGFFVKQHWDLDTGEMLSKVNRTVVTGYGFVECTWELVTSFFLLQVM